MRDERTSVSKTSDVSRDDVSGKKRNRRVSKGETIYEKDDVHQTFLLRIHREISQRHIHMLRDMCVSHSLPLFFPL